jgi:Outer membrane efflux protein
LPRIRQAKETNHQLKKEVEDARLRMHAEVISNWAQLQATASEIQSAQDALEANRIALEGVREEEKVGQRTTLDVLNAETRISRLANSACHGQAGPRRGRICPVWLGRAAGLTKPWFISTLL